MFTTNAIENISRQLCKAARIKSALASADAAMRMFYLTTMNVLCSI